MVSVRLSPYLTVLAPIRRMALHHGLRGLRLLLNSYKSDVVEIDATLWLQAICQASLTLQ